MTDRVDCPLCGGAMAEGYLADRYHTGSVAPATWVAGAPEYSKWTWEAKVKGREQYLLRSYRCEQCGYLATFAVERPVE